MSQHDALLFQNNANPALDRHWDQRESEPGRAVDLWPWTARQSDVTALLTPLRRVIFYDSWRKLGWDLGVTTGVVVPDVDFSHWGGGTLPGVEVLRLGFVDLDVPMADDYAWWRVAGTTGRSGSRTAYFRYTNDVVPARFADPLVRRLAHAAERREGDTSLSFAHVAARLVEAVGR
jgi:hypothetical protein